MRQNQSRMISDRDGTSLGKVAGRIDSFVRVLLERKHEANKYHIIHFLTRRSGGYRHCVHRSGLDDSPNCPRCTRKDAEPVIFHYTRFAMERRNLSQRLCMSVSRRNNCGNVKIEGELKS